jgi:hypothetical protein
MEHSVHYIFLLYSYKNNENQAGWLKQQFFKLAFWGSPARKPIGLPSILAEMFYDFLYSCLAMPG